MTQKSYEGIDFFALSEKKTLKAETQECVEIGLRQKMADLIVEYNKQADAARVEGRTPRPTPFIIR